MEDQQATTGTVKWFSNHRGFGFISCEGKENDIFVHYTNINKQGYKSLNEGDVVRFDIEKCDQGLKAINVNIIN